MTEKAAEPDISLDHLKDKLSELYSTLAITLEKAEDIESIGTMLPEAEAKSGPTAAEKALPLLEDLHLRMDKIQKRTDTIRTTLIRSLNQLRRKK